jgi:hypothetical protein
MTATLRRLESVDPVFGLEQAARLLAEVMAPWAQDLGLVIEKLESNRPAGAPEDWQAGAVLRLPFAARNCRDGGVERLSADNADQPDHAFPAAGQFRRPRRRARCAHRTDDDIRPCFVVECNRPTSGRNGVDRVCHVVIGV